MSKLEMSLVGRLVILIDNIDVGQGPGLRRDLPTPSILS